MHHRQIDSNRIQSNPIQRHGNKQQPLAAASNGNHQKQPCSRYMYVFASALAHTEHRSSSIDVFFLARHNFAACVTHFVDRTASSHNHEAAPVATKQQQQPLDQIACAINVCRWRCWFRCVATTAVVRLIVGRSPMDCRLADFESECFLCHMRRIYDESDLLSQRPTDLARSTWPTSLPPADVLVGSDNEINYIMDFCGA